jgi:hypothetical protein
LQPFSRKVGQKTIFEENVVERKQEILLTIDGIINIINMGAQQVKF